jgi:hypothetical protein
LLCRLAVIESGKDRMARYLTVCISGCAELIDFLLVLLQPQPVKVVYLFLLTFRAQACSRTDKAADPKNSTQAATTDQIDGCQGNRLLI